MTATARDLFVFAELSRATAAVRAEVFGPLAPFTESFNPAFDLTGYRKVIKGMRATLRAAARDEWRNIQESRAWEQMTTFALDWSELRFALLKLELAGIARRFHIVGVVDVQRACEVLSQMEAR